MYVLSVQWDCGTRRTYRARRFRALRAFLCTRPTWAHAVISRETTGLVIAAYVTSPGWFAVDKAAGTL